MSGRRPTQARWGSDGDVLAPRWAVAAVLSRNPELVSRHCVPVACDAHSRALLYDVDHAEEVLAGRARWPSSRRASSANCKTS